MEVEKQQHFVRKALWHFTLALGIGAILLLPRLLIMIQTPVDLVPSVMEYLNIIFVGLAITYLYNLYAATLRAV